MIKEEFKACAESICNCNACAWCRKHLKVAIGVKPLLFYKPKDDGDNNNPKSAKKEEIDSHRRVCKIHDWLKAAHDTHAGDHPIDRTLCNLINKKCGSSIPGWVCKMRADSCSACAFKHIKRTRVAGLRPILTKNFGTRGQIDLIYYSATPDGPRKCLLACCDHGMKIANAKPLTAKHLIAAAHGLLSVFAVMGPLDLLQSDNGGEFLNIARSSKTMNLNEQELQ